MLDLARIDKTLFIYGGRNKAIEMETSVIEFLLPFNLKLKNKWKH